MRLTPPHIAVQQICRTQLPFSDTGNSLCARIRAGRLSLRRLTEMDFGYDLPNWHDDLTQSRERGYTWARTAVLPKLMKQATESPEWQEAVAKLEKETQPRDQAGH